MEAQEWLQLLRDAQNNRQRRQILKIRILVIYLATLQWVSTMYAPNTSGNKQTKEANEQANSSPPEAFKLLSYYYHELILNSKQPWE